MKTTMSKREQNQSVSSEYLTKEFLSQFKTITVW